MRAPLRTLLVFPLALMTSFYGCGSEDPGPTPGVLTVTLVSPNGPEGAAHVKLFGEGIVEVRPLDARTFSNVRGDTADVVLVRDQPGDLRFQVALADETRVPTAAVLEFAGGDDRLRANLQSYRVELAP